MEGKVFLKSLALKNLLSFGPEGVEVELQPLNVLIGPNGSGKSNFIDSIRLLCSTYRSDMVNVLIEGGGIDGWIYKGSEPTLPGAYICGVINDIYHHKVKIDIVHEFAFTSLQHRFELIQESIHEITGFSPLVPMYVFAGRNATILRRHTHVDGSKSLDDETVEQLRTDRSILSQRRDPEAFSDITELASQYEKVKFFTESHFGRRSGVRKAPDSAAQQDFLFEDGSNLPLVLADLRNNPRVKLTILDNLKQLNDRISDFTTTSRGGVVELFLEEHGLFSNIAAARLSDGTLRYLCLLAILLHPDPPPLVCIEEPELGMHPDIIPTIARLLIEASKRMQLMVTTHSDLLVSCLDEIPETVLVCDRWEDGTRINRLNSKELASRLKDNSLGEIWLKGAIGGTRW